MTREYYNCGPEVNAPKTNKICMQIHMWVLEILNYTIKYLRFLQQKSTL